MELLLGVGARILLKLPEEINIKGLPVVVLLLVLVIHPLRLKVLTVRHAGVRRIVSLRRASFLTDRAQLRQIVYGIENLPLGVHPGQLVDANSAARVVSRLAVCICLLISVEFLKR